jgi:hypothetical protein
VAGRGGGGRKVGAGEKREKEQIEEIKDIGKEDDSANPNAPVEGEKLSIGGEREKTMRGHTIKTTTSKSQTRKGDRRQQ